MAALNTVFKEIFSDVFEQYGFVKVKGRYPYVARMIGDEIVQVITCRNEWCADLTCKAFSVLGGIATVYRQSINLKKSPNYNLTWLDKVASFYSKPKDYDFDNEYRIKLMDFIYEPEDEGSLRAALKYASEETIKNMLPVFDEVTDLEACIKYFDMFHSPAIFPPRYSEEENSFCCGRDNEGLLYIKTDNHDDLIEEYQKKLAKEMEAIESGKLSLDREMIREIYENGRIKKVTGRDEIYNNQKAYKKALEELEHRKVSNIEALRSCGLDI